MKKSVLTLRTAIAGLILIVIASFIYIRLTPDPPIPVDIRNKLKYEPYLLNADKGLVINKGSYKYDQNKETLSYVVHSDTYGELTISEQPTPQQFIDIPDVYNKVIDGLNRYSVFQNQLGTVYLTRPDGQKSGQTAVLNSSGVLMFVRSEKNLDDGQWRSIFNQVSLDKS
jgi:hypothetical protein